MAVLVLECLVFDDELGVHAFELRFELFLAEVDVESFECIARSGVDGLSLEFLGLFLELFGLFSVLGEL